MTYNDALKQLKESSKNLRCSEVLRILKHLKFNVKDGKKAGHKMFSHPGLREFHGSDFDCGHKMGAVVLPIYTRRILSIVSNHEQEIRAYLGETND